jgi:phosphate transport system substrate-binding protein
MSPTIERPPPFFRHAMRHPFLFLLLLTAIPAARADLVVVGSDLMGQNFATGLTTLAGQAKVAVQLDLTGSRVGLEKLRAGQADLALLVFSTQETPPGAPFVARPVAYHTAVVVVPASLPLAQVSYAQLRDLFSDNEGAATLVHWSDLGVTDPNWAAGKILLWMSGSGGGLSYDIFQHTVLPTPGLRSTVQVDLDGPAALKHTAVPEGGLAIVPSLPAGQDQLRVVPVARGLHDVAFLPTPENVHTGDYPIRLPLYVVFRSDARARVLPLLRILYGPEAVALWQGAQLVPLPPQARDQQVQDWAAP